MKRFIAIAAALALTASVAIAQTVRMEEASCAFDYPNSWLVISPQLCRVYAPLLREMGIDPEATEQELTEQGVQSRALSDTNEDSLSIICWADERSQTIFDIAEATDAERRSLRSLAENNSLFERTGLRAQDVEWQQEGGRYWLYTHYTVMRASDVIGRGLRYLTIHNGQYIVLDWRVTGRRFTNRDLSSFRRRISDLTFTSTLETPQRAVALACSLPTEVSEAAGRLTGTASPGANLALTGDDGKGNVVPLDESTADARGRFTLDYLLPREGAWALRLTAEAEGMTPAELTGEVTYSASTLPVSGIAEEMNATSDTFVLEGQTLPGVTLQLISPSGMTKKRVNSDGTFSFELTTKDPGVLSYTLLLDKKGYAQRRMRFTITRERTDEQQREKTRASAVRIAYRELARDLDKNQGAVLNLTGPVIALSQGGDTYYARVQYTKDADGKWTNPVILTHDAPFGAKEGDMLTCTVSAEGVYTEQDAQGNDIAIPRLRVLFIDKVE